MRLSKFRPRIVILLPVDVDVTVAITAAQTLVVLDLLLKLLLDLLLLLNLLLELTTVLLVQLMLGRHSHRWQVIDPNTFSTATAAITRRQRVGRRRSAMRISELLVDKLRWDLMSIHDL